MSRDLERKEYCHTVEGRVTQRVYGTNSLNEKVYGCVGECPHLDCEFNLNPRQEGERRNLFGRAVPWL